MGEWKNKLQIVFQLSLQKVTDKRSLGTISGLRRRFGRTVMVAEDSPRTLLQSGVKSKKSPVTCLNPWE